MFALAEVMMGGNVYLSISKITRFLFLLSLILYIIVINGYRLHVIPQLLLVSITIASLLLKKRIYNVSKKEGSLLLVLMFIGTILITLSELMSYQPRYAMPAKYILNMVMLLLLLFTYPSSTSNITDRHFILISFLFTVLLIIKYLGDYSPIYLLNLIATFLKGNMSSIDQYRAAVSIKNVFGHKNLFATFISSLSACYLAYLFLNKKKIDYKALIIMLSFFTGMVLTFSRSGLFIYFISIGVYGFLSVKGKYFKGAVFLLLCLSMWLIFKTHVHMRIGDGFYSRMMVWIEFKNNIGFNGILGKGSFLCGEIEAYDAGKFIESGNYHNYMLNQIASYGVIFFLVFTINGWIIIKKLYKMFGIVVTIPLTVFFANNMFQNWGFEYQSYLPFIFLFFVVNKAANARTS